MKAGEKLNTAISLNTSITGIGKITALYLTIFTNMFTRYENPKQLACYCGVVPFEYSSGTSIRKRSKVNHLVNKTLKKQLHLCALVAIQYDPELKIYYNRKIEEGKSKMLVINNMRNKLVHRVCAVIKKQQHYVRTVA
ncbi:MAG: IS110 family transposase [Flavobacteriaceae bacterium]|nr:IS110 family transposase [Flavobacteriaceae bacterium]